MTESNVTPEGGEGKREPAVLESGGKVMADSRDVAAYFGKRHDNVVRDVRQIILEMPHLRAEWEGGLLKSEETPADPSDLFRLTEYLDSQGKLQPCYLMTQDGFILLTMGYSGKEAMRLKLRYIARFNEMERVLRGRSKGLPPPNGLKSGGESIRNQPLRDQLRWLDLVRDLWGDDVAMEGYRETGLPILSGFQKHPRQGDLFRVMGARIPTKGEARTAPPLMAATPRVRSDGHDEHRRSRHGRPGRN